MSNSLQRAIMARELCSRKTVNFNLAVQERAYTEQSALFASRAIEAHSEKACEHAGDRQEQERLDGRCDIVCCACGDVVALAWWPKDSEEPDSNAPAAQLAPRPQLVREFSACGPCLTLGRLVRKTAHFYVYNPWRCGNIFEDREKRVAIPEHGSVVHIEACSSCMDHPRTSYPNGYMD